MSSWKDKTLVMIVGPSAIGKSTLMNEVIKQDARFGYVRSFTTRGRRPDEKTHYNFISRSDALRLHKDKQTLTYFEHPTTGDIYGTTEDSYPTEYNLLDTLSSSVEDYRNLPFKHTITVSLTAPADQWRQWFLSRYPEPSEEAQKRLKEAEQSIMWSLQDPETYWLENPADHLEETATQLIKIVLGGSAPQGTDQPQALLDIIQKDPWQLK